MSSLRSSSFANLTPQRLAELAERDDCVVYQPTHDVQFTPWSAERVRSVVGQIVRLARRCDTEEDARRQVREKLGPEAAEFEGKYQLLFQRLTEPRIAKNPDHVAIVLKMIELRSRVEQGTLTEHGAQSLVSEQCLTGLLSQVSSNAVPRE